MKENKELERKVGKILQDMKIPKEIKKLVKSIYEEYEEACKDYKKRIIMAENKGNSRLIEQLAKDINNVYKQDVSTLNMVISNIYEEKNIKTEEELQSEIMYIEGIKEKELEPILFDSKGEEEYYQEHNDEIKIERIVKNGERDQEFIKTVKDIIISEINSSKNYIELEIRNNAIFDKNEEQVFYERKIKNQFKEDIDRVIQRVQEEFPTIEFILRNQEEEVYKAVMKEIEDYKKSQAIKQEQRDGNQVKQSERENFVENLHVEVNSQEAVKKVAENSENKLENSRDILPGNVIE